MPSRARRRRAATYPPRSASRSGSRRGTSPARWRAPRTPRRRPRQRATKCAPASFAERALRKRIREERAQGPASLARGADGDDLEVEPELGEQLAARAARRGGRVDLGGDHDALELSRPGGHGRTHRHPLGARSEEHTSELQSRQYLVCRLLLEKKK